MGFMDKFKDAAAQAGDAAKKMGDATKDGMNPANIGVANDMNRIGTEGVETTAKLISLKAISGEKLGGGTEYELQLEVTPPGGGEPYAATCVQQLSSVNLGHYEGKAGGGEIGVKVDPADPSKMLLWG